MPYRQKTISIAMSFCILPLSLASVSGIGCHSGPNDEKALSSKQTTHGHGGVVYLADDLVQEFGLEVSPVGPAVIEQTLKLTGEVRANKDRLAHIVPRFGGIVTETRKRIGDHVSSGETLAVIESSRSLTPYTLKTMLDGLIIEKHATKGEAVSAETEAFVVADLSTVWVDLDVRLGDLQRVRPGQSLRIESIHGAESATGTISYVTPVVDENSRTATARVVLENKSGFWRPGMFAVAHLALDPSEVAAAVPKNALHSIGAKTVVFVANGNSFRPRAVQVGLKDEHLAEVLGDLDPGEEVVVKGGFTVKSELLRDHFSNDHVH